MHQQKFLLAKRFLLSASVISGMGLLAILPNSALAQDIPEATPTPQTPLPIGTPPAATPSAIPEPTPAPEPISGEVEAETEAEGVLVEETEMIDTGAVTEESTEDELGVEADAITTPDGGTAPATEIPAATPVSNPATTNSSPRALW